MDKETLSNYGWIVICVLVLAVMIALATPFGSFVADAVKSTTQGLFDVNQSALNSTGLIKLQDQNFKDSLTTEKITISFKINGTKYTADKGMTWEDWINSDYNFDEYIVMDGCIVNGSETDLAVAKQVCFVTQKVTSMSELNESNIILESQYYAAPNHLIYECDFEYASSPWCESGFRMVEWSSVRNAIGQAASDGFCVYWVSNNHWTNHMGAEIIEVTPPTLSPPIVAPEVD